MILHNGINSDDITVNELEEHYVTNLEYYDSLQWRGSTIGIETDKYLHELHKELARRRKIISPFNGEANKSATFTRKKMDIEYVRGYRDALKSCLVTYTSNLMSEQLLQGAINTIDAIMRGK